MRFGRRRLAQQCCFRLPNIVTIAVNLSSWESFTMPRSFAPFTVVCLLTIFAAVAWANRAPPDVPAEPAKRDAVAWAPVVIKADALKGDDAGAKAKIVIPRS